MTAEVASGLLSEGWLREVADALAGLDGLDAPGAADGAAQFVVSGSPAGAARFHAVVDSGRVTVSAGRHPRPDVILELPFADFSAAWRGELSLEAAYMSGRMKLAGDQVLLFDGWRPLLESQPLRAALAGLA